MWRSMAWACLSVLVAAAGAAGQSHAEEAIGEVIESAYIDGIQRNGDRAAIRAGFHPGFVMKVLDGNSVRDVRIEEWIDRLPPEEEGPRADVTHHVTRVLVHGSAAVAEVELFFGGRHRFTDLISLYEIDGAWKIVAKIYQPLGRE